MSGAVTEEAFAGEGHRQQVGGLRALRASSGFGGGAAPTHDGRRAELAPRKLQEPSQNNCNSDRGDSNIHTDSQTPEQFLPANT